MEYVITVAKWLVVSSIIGLLGGGFGTLFHHGVEHATHLRMENEMFLWLLPFAGLTIVVIYQIMRTEGLGTNVVIDAVHQGYAIPILLVPSIFCGTILTHLAGGSAGREGAALQIGGGIGHSLGRAFRMDEKDCRIATMCGMSALFSALFGTPLAATIFALEVISVGVLYYAAFIPCLTAALVAYGLSLKLHVEPTRFAVSAPQISGGVLLRTAILAGLCALVCILFCEVLHYCGHFAVKAVKNPYTRAFVGGCVIIAMTKLVGTYDYNGAGMDVINAAIAGEAKPEAFLLKMIFSAVTLSCGFKGGEVVPTFFVGATFGCAAGTLLGLPAGFAASLGITALFCGMVNCPITSLIISVELFGAEGLICYAVACAVSYVLSGYRGLYSSQTILYSKLRAEFINIHTK
ncbi:MAG: chloride channel protein [Oscillospiraceae bacterium]|nr:chloride channel protein [Oscillospiraceae bacterium]